MEAVGAPPPRLDPPRPGAVVARVGLACLAPTMIALAGWRASSRIEPSAVEWPPTSTIDLEAPCYVDAYPGIACDGNQSKQDQGSTIARFAEVANPFAQQRAAPADSPEVFLPPNEGPSAAPLVDSFTPPRLEAETPRVRSDAPATMEDEALFALRVSADEALAYTPVSHELSRSLAPQVQQGFQLGKSGALYAAREKFLGVLREVAAAKDAAEQTTRFSTSLEEGLLALEESDDFVETRAVGGAAVPVAQLAASHHTPLLQAKVDADGRPEMLPHEAAAVYHRYGEAKLGVASLGEPAGSMALYGLGKTYARMAEREGLRVAESKSLSFFRAASIAHPGNHMAANEVGVHLARAGHYEESHRALAAAVAHQPDSMIFRNLAVVEQSLGRPDQALAAQARADQLAAQEKSTGAFARSRGVQWVDPAQFQSTTPSSPGVPPTLAEQSPPTAPRTAQNTGPLRSMLGWGESGTVVR